MPSPSDQSERRWWTEIPEGTEFMDRYAEWKDALSRGKEPADVKDPCVLCGFTCDTAATPIFATPRGRAHLWCSHVMRGAEIARLERELKEARDAC